VLLVIRRSLHVCDCITFASKCYFGHVLYFGMHICIYIYICVCVCVCVCIYVCFFGLECKRVGGETEVINR
jgi:hypothetical protein